MPASQKSIKRRLAIALVFCVLAALLGGAHAEGAALEAEGESPWQYCDFLKEADIELSDSDDFGDDLQEAGDGMTDLTEARESAAPDDTSWRNLQQAIDSSEAGAVIRLDKDIAAGRDDAGLVIPPGKNLTLDLAGHVLDRGLDGLAYRGYVMMVRGKLTVTDSSAEARGRITGGHNAGNGGGIVVANKGVMRLGGGCICENSSAGDGGAVYVRRVGAFVMRGGVIRDNVADGRGGGVFDDGGRLTVSGSPVIADNRSTLSGAAEPNNVCIGLRDLIRVDGKLSAEARIGINGDCHVFTRGLEGHGSADAFIPDSGLFEIGYGDDSPEAQISFRGEGGTSAIQPWTGPFDYIAYSALLDEPGLRMNSTEYFEYVCSEAHGFTRIKGDLRLTADNGIVMCHDAGFTLNGEGKITAYDPANSVNIRDMTLAQCLALQYENMYAGKYTSVCDFETFLDICARHDMAVLITIRDEYIPELVEAMMPLIDKYAMREGCIVNSFDRDSLEAVARVDGGIRLSWVINRGELTRDMVDDASAMGRCTLTLYSLGVRGGGLQSLALNEYEIIYAQRRDVPLYAAIVDDVSDVDHLKRLGFCGAQFMVDVPSPQM